MNQRTNHNLKAEIIKKYGSQVAFSNELGLREQLVSQVINRRRILKAEEKAEWAKALSCKLEEIFPIVGVSGG